MERNRINTSRLGFDAWTLCPFGTPSFGDVNDADKSISFDCSHPKVVEAAEKYRVETVITQKRNNIDYKAVRIVKGDLKSPRVEGNLHTWCPNCPLNPFNNR